MVGAPYGSCYTGDNFEAYDSITETSINRPSSCSRWDTRYTLVDYLSEVELFDDNFQYVSDCNGIDYYTSDVRAGGAACGTTGRTCAVTKPSGFTCSSTDSICQYVTTQTKCGKYRHISNIASSTIKWGRFYMVRGGARI